jgi:predicted Zn-dependent peptidase
MNYHKYTFNGINLYFIKTLHFKKVKIKLSFRMPIRKKDITINKFLIRSLLYSTKQYPTQRLFLLAQQELYNISFGWDSYRRGTHLFSEFTLSGLNNKYTEKGNIEKAIALLIDAILKPNVINGSFDEEMFKIIYSRMKEDLNSLKENKRLYATIRMKQIMGVNEPYAYVMDGYLDDLNKITPSNLYRHYQKWLNESTIDIFVAGDVNVQETIQLFENFLSWKEKVPLLPSIYYEHSQIAKNIKTSSETDDIKQAKLVMGYKLKGITNYERQYVIPIYNIIFGSVPTSKLFTIIREKHSLCYSISSTFDIPSNIMYIRAGIDKEKYDKTVALVKEMMQEMMDGNFSEARIKEAKIALLEDIKAIIDNLSSMIDLCQTDNLLNFDDIKIARAKIRKVSADDIISVAKKIHLDTIFLLHGGVLNENH